MPTAFSVSAPFTVPGSSTNTALVRWSGTGGNQVLDSAILVGATTMGLAADTDLVTFSNGTLTIAGTVAATTLTGAGAGITALNGTQVTTGTLPAARIGDDSIVEAKLDVSNGPTNGYFLQAQSGEGGGLTWAAVSSAISREGGTTSEATTTSTSAMDLITISSLTIAAASPWTMTSLWRKTTGHASAASGGLKIVADSTVVTGESTTAATLWQSGTSNLAEDGGTDTTVGAKVTNYLASNAQNNIVSRNSSSGGFTYGNVGTLTKDAVFPVGQTTSIVLRANSGNASVTTGSDEVHIYVLSVS